MLLFFYMLYTPNFRKIFNLLNLKKQCDQYRVGLWGCPQFLFVIMGVVIVISIIGTNIAVRRYAEPEISALVVMGVTAILFAIGHAVVSSFERVAEDSLAKSEFISIVSHELRNPLTSLRWQFDLLKRDYLNLSEKQRQEALEIIGNDSKRMNEVVSDMLAVHRVEEKAFKLNPEFFSLVDLTGIVAKNYEKQAQKNGVKIEISVQENLPPVFADKKKIQMVIEHLIDNALKYGRQKQTVRVEIEKDGKKTRWSVSDQGVGILEKDAEKIFQKFFRARNALWHQIEGIGLGLYIARQIIEKSGGEINFKSRENKGSTFWFTI